MPLPAKIKNARIGMNGCREYVCLWFSFEGHEDEDSFFVYDCEEFEVEDE